MPEITVEPLHYAEPARHKAMRYDGTNRDAMLAFCEHLFHSEVQAPGKLWLTIPSPTKEVRPGDWVVRTSYYGTQVLSDEVFRATYAEVPEQHCVDIRLYLRTGSETGLAHASGSSARVLGSTLARDSLYELARTIETHDPVRLALALTILEAIRESGI